MKEQVAPDLNEPRIHRGARVLPALFLGRGGGGRRIFSAAMEQVSCVRPACITLPFARTFSYALRAASPATWLLAARA